MTSFLLLGVQLNFKIFLSKVHDQPTQRKGCLNNRMPPSLLTFLFFITKDEVEFYSIHSEFVVHHHAFQPLDGTI